MNAPQTNLKKDTQKAAKLTPMMAQFLEIKAGVGPEALLFYRMGDFCLLYTSPSPRDS